MSSEVFPHWSAAYFIKDKLRNKSIEAGDYSYYAGYYHKEHFDEICVRYLHGDPESLRAIAPDLELDRLVIGKFCCFASGCVILLGGNHGHNPELITVYPFPEMKAQLAQTKGDTVIGNDVWIGTEAMIMPGVTIGDGAIVAARAVVARDVEPYSVVAGNLAQVVRKRFSEAEIARLVEIRWWDWPIADIKAAQHLLCSGEVDLLYRFHANRVAARPALP